MPEKAKEQIANSIIKKRESETSNDVQIKNNKIELSTRGKKINVVNSRENPTATFS